MESRISSVGRIKKLSERNYGMKKKRTNLISPSVLSEELDQMQTITATIFAPGHINQENQNKFRRP